MKKFAVVLVTLVLMSQASVWAGGFCEIRGVTYTVDTLFYNIVGPGTTQTTLGLRNATTPANSSLRVFYTTIDMTNPYVSLECILGYDELRFFQTLESMARHHTSEGHQPFIGINGDLHCLSSS